MRFRRRALSTNPLTPFCLAALDRVVALTLELRQTQVRITEQEAPLRTAPKAGTMKRHKHTAKELRYWAEQMRQEAAGLEAHHAGLTALGRNPSWSDIDVSKKLLAYAVAMENEATLYDRA